MPVEVAVECVVKIFTECYNRGTGEPVIYPADTGSEDPQGMSR